MVKKCVVPHCWIAAGEDDGKGEAVSFHRFPQEPLMRAEWIRRSGRGPDFEPTNDRRFCSKHFTADCYRLNSRDHNLTRRKRKYKPILRPRILFDDAVPTLFEAYLHSCTAGECYVHKKKCVHCDDYIAYSEKDLRHHISAFHVGYLPLGCEHCLDKQRASWFATEESLELHTVLDHTVLDVKAVPKRDKRKEGTVDRMMEKCPGSNKTRAESENEREEKRKEKAKPPRTLVDPRRKSMKQNSDETDKPTEVTNKPPENSPDKPPEASKTFTSAPEPQQLKVKFPDPKCRTLFSARSSKGTLFFTVQGKKQQGKTDKAPSHSPECQQQTKDTANEQQQSSPVVRQDSPEIQPPSPIPIKREREESKSPNSLPPETSQKSARKRARPGTEKEKSPYPKVPKLSFARDYVERITMPDDIGAYLEQRRQELGIEEESKKKKGPKPKERPTEAEKAARPINTSLDEITANSFPKPKVPARYSLGTILKSKEDSSTDNTTTTTTSELGESLQDTSEQSGPPEESPHMAKLRVVRNCPNIAILRQRYVERMIKLKELKIKKSREKEKTDAINKRVKKMEQNQKRREKMGSKRHLQPQGELLFACALCDAAVYGTVDHVGNIHLSSDRFICGHCNYTSGCHRIMRNHSQKHHPDREKKIEANDDLEDELVQKHMECFGFDYQTAEFECQMCGQIVAFAGEKLITHSRVKHLNSAAKCATCEEIFNDVDAYICHHDQVHPDVMKRYRKPTAIEMQNACFPGGSQPVPPDYVPRSIDVGARSTCRIGITCLKCNKAVGVQAASEHAREHSPTAEPHTCPCCNFFDLKARIVASHIKRVHPKMAHLANGISNKKEVLEENRKSMLECFGFNLIECDYCHLAVTFWELRPHAKRHVEELLSMGQRRNLAQMAQECYGTVVQVK